MNKVTGFGSGTLFTLIIAVQGLCMIDMQNIPNNACLVCAVIFRPAISHSSVGLHGFNRLVSSLRAVNLNAFRSQIVARMSEIA